MVFILVFTFFYLIPQKCPNFQEIKKLLISIYYTYKLFFNMKINKHMYIHD